MGWKGIAWGAFIGGNFGGPLGAIIGGAIGCAIENGIGGKSKRPTRRRTVPPGGGEKIFCASAAAMLAKLAKADGHITQAEIDCAERVFARLGFSQAARETAIAAFRRAKDDAYSIYDYARDFGAVAAGIGVRELFYELLWELAAADGEISIVEERLLRGLVAPLGISPHWFAMLASQYAGMRASARSHERAAPRRDSLAEAYATLGVPQTATDAEVRRAYREKAKQYHPDRLRAQGLPDGMIAKANERMAALNAAFAAIKEARKS